jgi:hypothetical protein
LPTRVVGAADGVEALLIEESYERSVCIMKREIGARASDHMGDPEITGEVEIDLGLRRRSLREPFLKGPLLLSELVPVAQMPGKALALWLLIRHRAAVNRDHPCTLPPRILAEWGIGKDAKIAALRRLEQGGLISVERPKGYMVKVKLI